MVDSVVGRGTVCGNTSCCWVAQLGVTCEVRLWLTRPDKGALYMSYRSEGEGEDEGESEVEGYG
jgi:hypothetical protein